MCPTQSEKKIFEISEKTTVSIDYINDFIFDFSTYFWAHRHNNTDTARQYIQGLLLCSKGQANMERMEEEIEDSEYRAYQHFITNSNWDDEGLRAAISKETSIILSNQKSRTGNKTGYIVSGLKVIIYCYSANYKC